MQFAEPSWTREISAMVLAVYFEVYQRDVLPYPLQYQPRGDFDDYLRQHRQAASWIEQHLDEPLWNALDTLLNPRFRIQSLLFTGRASERRHEFHAALRHGTATIVAKQHDRPETIVLTSCGQPEALVRTVAFLPETQAGQRKPLRVWKDEVEAEPASWLDQDTARDQVDYMFRRPRDAWGEIAVVPGIGYDIRPASDGIGLLWCDYPGDGRYYVENDKEIVAEPVDQQGLHERITKAAVQIERRAVAP